MVKKQESKGKDIGFGIKIPPKPDTYDKHDPFYGELSIKKNSFVAKVVSAKCARTAVVLVERQVFDKKYQRYTKARSRIQVHNPSSVNAKEGDVVRVFETKPISKTKHNVIVEVKGQFVDIKGQDLAKEAKENKAEAKLEISE